MQKQPSEGFFKRDVTRNLQENISAGISFLIKLNSCRPVSSLKKEWCFLVSFANFLITPFLKNTNWTTASNYSSTKSSEGKIDKRSCRYQSEPEV